MTTVKIECKDGEEFEMDKELAEKCSLLKGMIEETGGDEALPVGNVSKQCLTWVSEYLTLVKADGDYPEIEKPLTSDDISGSVSNEKFIEFLQDREPKDLFEMALGGVTLGLP